MPLLATAFSTGFIAQASLIMVIGAQNSFVLRQGILQNHVGPIVCFCIVSDILLAALGVIGLASVLSLYPAAVTGMEYVAIAFLVAYAGLSFHRAIKAEAPATASSKTSAGLTTSLALMAGFTWLNPHVWLDSFLLLGTVAQTQPLDGKLPFLAGASLASTMWFVILGYGARLMQPLFAEPLAWRVLDSLTGMMMAGLALALVLK